MLSPLRNCPGPSRREEPRDPQTTLVGELAQCGDEAEALRRTDVECQLPPDTCLRKYDFESID